MRRSLPSLIGDDNFPTQRSHLSKDGQQDEGKKGLRLNAGDRRMECDQTVKVLGAEEGANRTLMGHALKLGATRTPKTAMEARAPAQPPFNSNSEQPIRSGRRPTGCGRR